MSGKNAGFQSEKYEKKVEFAESFVENNFDLSFEEFIEEENWEESTELCSNVLSDGLTKEDRDYLNEKLDLAHLKDSRRPVEYACDLIVGWVLEDGILRILKEEMELETTLSSADKNRKFLKSPDATPDMTVIKSDGTKIPLELAQDFTGYWQRKGKIDLRDNKYVNIKEEDGVLLGLDFENEDFFVVDISETDGHSHYHPPFGKEAYTFGFDGIEFHDLEDMKEVLTEHFGGR